MSDYISRRDEILLDLTASIVSARITQTSVSTGDNRSISDIIAEVHAALVNALGGKREPEPAPAVELEPAVPIRASVKPDYIVCLEDGKKLKMLKRYLRTQFNMTPEEYIAKWKLPRDYPMVAPNYAEVRRTLAKKLGLGTKEFRGEPGLPLDGGK